MTKWIVAVVLSLSLVFAPASQAGSIGRARAVNGPTSRAPEGVWVPYLAYSDAVAMVRETGGFVHRCKRVAPRHFHCRATWWFQRHEAELEPDGSLVNEIVTSFSEEATCEVWLGGVSINFPETSET